MLKAKRTTVIMAVVAVAFIGFGLTGKASVPEDKAGSYYTMTPDEMQEIKDKTSQISIKDVGEFVRVQQEQPVSPAETVRSIDDVNESTKQIILDYGIFVKQ